MLWWRQIKSCNSIIFVNVLFTLRYVVEASTWLIIALLLHAITAKKVPQMQSSTLFTSPQKWKDPTYTMTGFVSWTGVMVGIPLPRQYSAIIILMRSIWSKERNGCYDGRCNLRPQYTQRNYRRLPRYCQLSALIENHQRREFFRRMSWANSWTPIKYLLLKTWMNHAHLQDFNTDGVKIMSYTTVWSTTPFQRLRKLFMWTKTCTWNYSTKVIID